MAGELTSLLTIISIVLIVLLGIFIIKGIKQRVDVLYFSLAIGVGLIGNMLNSTVGLYTISKLGSYLFTLTFFFIFLQYEHIKQEKPDKILYPLFIALNAVSFGFLLAMVGVVGILAVGDPTIDVITGAFYSDNDIINICIIGQLSTGTVVSILELLRSLTIVVKLNKFLNNTKTKMEVVYLLLLLMYRILMIFGLIQSYYQPNSIFVTISLLCVMVGIFIALISYIVYTEDFLRIPFPVHSFMIYNRGGMMVYSRLTQVVKFEKNYDDALISGTYSAVNSIIEEIFGQGVKIRRIITDNYQIYFMPLPEPGGTLVVTALGSTGMFYQSLKRFTKLIPASLLEDINESGTNLLEIKPPMDTLIQSTFPYVLFRKEE